MRQYGLLNLLAVVALAQVVPGLSAYAQEAPGRGTTVLERPRPETDPLGIRTDGFLLFPSISVTERFRDNIFFDDEDSTVNPNDLQGDFITVLSAALLVQSDWNNHQLNFFGDADLGSFLGTLVPSGSGGLNGPRGLLIVNDCRDSDGDNAVGAADLAALLGAWGPCQ